MCFNVKTTKTYKHGNSYSWNLLHVHVRWWRHTLNFVIPSSTIYTYLFVSTTYEKKKSIIKRDVQYESEEKILGNMIYRSIIPLISLMQFYCDAIYFHTFSKVKTWKCHLWSVIVILFLDKLSHQFQEVQDRRTLARNVRTLACLVRELTNFSIFDVIIQILFTSACTHDHLLYPMFNK